MLLYHTFPLLHPNEIIKLFFLWSIIPTHPIINLSFLKQCFALFFFFFYHDHFCVQTSSEVLHSYIYNTPAPWYIIQVFFFFLIYQDYLQLLPLKYTISEPNSTFVMFVLYLSHFTFIPLFCHSLCLEYTLISEPVIMCSFQPIEKCLFICFCLITNNMYHIYKSILDILLRSHIISS